MENKRKRGSGRHRDEQTKLKVSGLEYQTRKKKTVPKKQEPNREVSLSLCKNICDTEGCVPIKNVRLGGCFKFLPILLDSKLCCFVKFRSMMMIVLVYSSLVLRLSLEK